MSDTQTPLWLPLLLAGIALIGPIGAAWLNAKSSNNRWDKENSSVSSRESEQWRRDRFRMILESKRAWRELRLAHYSQMLSKMNEMHRAAVTLLVDKKNRKAGASTGDSESFLLYQEIWRDFEELMLISSDDVRRSVFSLNSCLMKMLQYLTPSPGQESVELLTKATEQSRLYEEQLNEVRRMIRDDLATDVPESI